MHGYNIKAGTVRLFLAWFFTFFAYAIMHMLGVSGNLWQIFAVAGTIMLFVSDDAACHPSATRHYDFGAGVIRCLLAWLFALIGYAFVHLFETSPSLVECFAGSGMFYLFVSDNDLRRAKAEQ